MVDIANRSKAFAEQCLQSLQKFDLPFILPNETPADGDCFYYAVLEILTNYQDISSCVWNNLDFEDELTMPITKSQIIDHRRKLGTLDIVCENCSNNCQDGDQHLEYLSRNKIWADEFIIQGVTSLLEVTLCLISPNTDPEYYSWGKTTNGTIYMFYFPSLHFQSMIPSVGNDDLSLILSNFSIIRDQITLMERPCFYCEVEIGKQDSVTCFSCKNIFHKSSCAKNHGCTQIHEPKVILDHNMKPMTRSRKNRNNKNHSIRTKKIKHVTKRSKRSSKSKDDSSPEYIKLLKEYLSYEHYMMNDDLSEDESQDIFVETGLVGM